jgi:hypothetical protein
VVFTGARKNVVLTQTSISVLKTNVMFLVIPNIFANMLVHIPDKDAGSTQHP